MLAPFTFDALFNVVSFAVELKCLLFYLLSKFGVPKRIVEEHRPKPVFYF